MPLIVLNLWSSYDVESVLGGCAVSASATRSGPPIRGLASLSRNSQNKKVSWDLGPETHENRSRQWSEREVESA